VITATLVALALAQQAPPAEPGTSAPGTGQTTPATGAKPPASITPASNPDAHAPTTAADATPAQLFARAIAAVGPTERVPCLRAEGAIETPEGRSEITILWNARPPRRIVVRERMADGREAAWGCTGERGWMRVPGRDATLDVEPAAVIATKAGLVPSLMVMALADRFPLRTPGADETLDGIACRRVDLEDRDGLPGAAWFEVTSGRLHAFRTQASRADAPTVTTIEAWADAGPLHVPARLVSRSGDRVVRTTFTRLAIEALPDAEFAAPPR
jgi:hypothetical protein